MLLKREKTWLIQAALIDTATVPKSHTVNQQILAAIKFGISQNKMIGGY